MKYQYKAKSIGSAHVAVVDDELSIADFVSETLMENGYQVTAFTDPFAALHAVKTGQFDLALVDINMP